MAELRRGRVLVGKRRREEELGSCDSDSDSEIEVDIEPLVLEGAVVAVIQGGQEGGTVGRLASKRKRKNELAQQPVRHSLWEQGSLEAHNEVLFGHLEDEVRALKHRKCMDILVLQSSLTVSPYVQKSGTS